MQSGMLEEAKEREKKKRCVFVSADGVVVGYSLVGLSSDGISDTRANKLRHISSSNGPSTRFPHDKCPHKSHLICRGDIKIIKKVGSLHRP